MGVAFQLGDFIFKWGACHGGTSVLMEGEGGGSKKIIGWRVGAPPCPPTMGNPTICKINNFSIVNSICPKYHCTQLSSVKKNCEEI